MFMNFRRWMLLYLVRDTKQGLVGESVQTVCQTVCWSFLLQLILSLEEQEIFRYGHPKNKNFPLLTNSTLPTKVTHSLPSLRLQWYALYHRAQAASRPWTAMSWSKYCWEFKLLTQGWTTFSFTLAVSDHSGRNRPLLCQNTSANDQVFYGQSQKISQSAWV